MRIQDEVRDRISLLRALMIFGIASDLIALMLLAPAFGWLRRNYQLPSLLIVSMAS